MATSWLRDSLLRRRRAGQRTPAGPPAATRALLDTKLWYLSRINLFADMTDAEMRWLAGRTVMRRHTRGQAIVQSDDPLDAIYLVKEGRVKLCRYSSAGREQIVALLDRGDIVGERGLLGADSGTRCEAFDDALVCVLRRRDFEDLIQRKPDLALRVMRALAMRLQQAEEAIEALAFQDVPTRLDTLLTRLADSYGEPHPEGRRLVLRLTHQDLANMIGATRETVTGVLNRFQDEGRVLVEERHIVIRDAARPRAPAG